MYTFQEMDLITRLHKSKLAFVVMALLILAIMVVPLRPCPAAREIDYFICEGTFGNHYKSVTHDVGCSACNGLGTQTTLQSLIYR